VFFAIVGAVGNVQAFAVGRRIRQLGRRGSCPLLTRFS